MNYSSAIALKWAAFVIAGSLRLINNTSQIIVAVFFVRDHLFGRYTVSVR